MDIKPIQTLLNDLQTEIALKHSASKADLFVEFLRKKRELEDMLESLKTFTEGSFDEK